MNAFVHQMLEYDSITISAIRRTVICEILFELEKKHANGQVWEPNESALIGELTK